jgi:hypothetical protein
VVLSSGFLAFAQHAGFLQAVEEVRSAMQQQMLCFQTAIALGLAVFVAGASLVYDSVL